MWIIVVGDFVIYLINRLPRNQQLLPRWAAEFRKLARGILGNLPRKTVVPSYARQRRYSKMAVSRHLGYYRTGNSVIRSATPKTLAEREPNMEWIGCTVCEIFTFKLYCDLETGVRGHSIQGHRKWHYLIEHIRLYIRLPCLYLVPFPRYSRILDENCYPLVFDVV